MENIGDSYTWDKYIANIPRSALLKILLNLNRDSPSHHMHVTPLVACKPLKHQDETSSINSSSLAPDSETVQVQDMDFE